MNHSITHALDFVSRIFPDNSLKHMSHANYARGNGEGIYYFQTESLPGGMNYPSLKADRLSKVQNMNLTQDDLRQVENGCTVSVIYDQIMNGENKGKNRISISIPFIGYVYMAELK
jgi:hypothetical protein